MQKIIKRDTLSAIRFRFLLPLLGKVSDYVTHIQKKYADLEGDKRTCAPG